MSERVELLLLPIALSLIRSFILYYMLPVIAIFDVGKTNKKVFLFNEQYEIVWEKTDSFAESVDDDGAPCEDLSLLIIWVQQSLQEVLALPDFDVQGVNFSAYGASFVNLDTVGKPVGYLYNYLKPFPAHLRQCFFEQYGPETTLSTQTASPALDSLNSGLMLYRLKHDKPYLFEQIKYALHLPQYLSFLVTGQYFTDLTSIGCHTMLWDFVRHNYHDWVIQEGLDQHFGPVRPADQPLTIPCPGKTASGKALLVGIGLHDSSAALIPYLTSFSKVSNSSPFLLISTGTWCISMNPFTKQPLTVEELQYDCLNYLTYQGQPVKASRLFAGYEHEQQTKRLAAHFQVAHDFYKQVRYNPGCIAQLQQAASFPSHTSEGLIAPVRMPSLAQSAFSTRNLNHFADYETAYHQLMLDLMTGQLLSTALVLPPVSDHQLPISRIFVDGGFSHNPIYMNLLAAAFPDVEVWAASVAQATALGAALAFHQHWNTQPLPTNLITLTHYKGK